MTFNLKNALRAIDARAPDLTEDREKMKTAMGPRLDPNSVENRIGRARQNEKAVLEQLQFLSTQPEGEARNARVINAVNRLAELRAEQGDYAHAAEIAQDESQRKRYEQLQSAIEKPDVETCDCSPDRIFDGKREMNAPNAIVSEQIISPRHGGLVNVVRCVKCGHLNAR